MPSIKISKNEKWEQDKLDEYTLEKKIKSYKSRWSLHRHYRKRNGFDANWRHDSLQKEKTKSKNCSRNRLFHGSKKAATKILS
jgi:hypothetical protein